MTTDEIQAALDAKWCELPLGTFPITRPLTVRHSGTVFRGASRASNDPRVPGTRLQNTGFVGPLLLSIPDTIRDNPAYNLRLVPSLVPGPGQAQQLSPATMYADSYVDYANVIDARWDGRTAFALEFYWRPDTISTGYLFSSGGALGDVVSHSAIEITLANTGILGCKVDVNGTTRQGFTPTPVSVGAIRHFAVCYDGATLRFFDDGRAFFTQSVTGPLVQKWYEHCCFGTRRLRWPNGAVNYQPVNAAVDSLRVSKVARYSADFTPPAAKHGWDTNTLLLHNFDRESDPCLSVLQTVRSPNHYLLKFGTIGGTAIDNVEIGRMAVHSDHGVALDINGLVGSHVHDLVLTGGPFALRAQLAFTNCFERINVAERVGGHEGCAVAFARGGNGVNSISDLFITGYKCGFVVFGGGGDFRNWWMNGSRDVGVYLGSDNRAVVFTMLNIAEEDLTNSSVIAPVIIGSNQNILFDQAHIEAMQFPTPAVIVCDAGPKYVQFNNPRFVMHPSAAQVVRVSGAGTPKLVFINEQHSGSMPLCNVPVTMVG